MHTLRVAVLAVALGILGPPAFAGGDVNVWLGSKSLSQDVSDVGFQSSTAYSFGLMTSFCGKRWPVALAVDYFSSVNVEPAGPSSWKGLGTDELHLGARKVWVPGQNGVYRPYVGGGAAFASGTVTAMTPFGWGSETSDNALGFWIEGGVGCLLAKHFNVGIDARFSRASVNLPLGAGGVDADVKAGGFHLGGFIGYGW